MLRISIYDDNNSLRATLRLLLDATDDLLVIGDYENALDVLATVGRDQPDVVLMDIEMPGRTGIEAVRLLHSMNPALKVLMLTVFEDTEHLFAALSAGAVGYLLKKTPGPAIAEAVREVARGGAMLTPAMALKLLDTFRRPAPGQFALTDRETEVLHCLVKGDSYKLIADHCRISMGTVRTHIVNIYDKLHVNSKSEAVAKAIGAGLFR
jgi:DNA-binding NarL/FixJ family response regulator